MGTSAVLARVRIGLAGPILVCALLVACSSSGGPEADRNASATTGSATPPAQQVCFDVAEGALLADLAGGDVLTQLHHDVGPRSATAQAVAQARTDTQVREIARSQGTEVAVEEAAPLLKEACADATLPEPPMSPRTDCGMEVLAALEQTTFPVDGSDGNYSAYLNQWGPQSERAQALISLSSDPDLTEDFMTSGLPGVMRSASLEVDALCESDPGDQAGIDRPPDQAHELPGEYDPLPEHLERCSDILYYYGPVIADSPERAEELVRRQFGASAVAPLAEAIVTASEDPGFGVEAATAEQLCRHVGLD